MFGEFDLTTNAIQLARLADIFSFHGAQALGSIFELAKVGLLDIISDSLVTFVILTLDVHLLTRLFQLQLAPFQVGVDRVAKDSDFRVKFFVFFLIEFRLKPVRFGTF